MEELLDRYFSDDPRDYTFIEETQLKQERDYHTTEAEFVDYYKNVKGVCAIYKYGTFTNPGLSDLDFVVVLDDDFRHPFGLDYDIEHFSDTTRYLLYHKQTFMSRTDVRDLALNLPPFGLHKVWGEDAGMRYPDENEEREILFFNWLGYMIYGSGRYTTKYLLEKTIYDRRAISKLKVLRYSYRFLKEIGEFSDRESDNFCRDVQRLRDGWFDTDVDSRALLVKLLKKGVVLEAKLIPHYERILKATAEQSGFSMDGLRETSFMHRKVVTYFLKEWDPLSNLESSMRHFQQAGIYSQTLPLSFLFALSEYAKTDGPLGKYLRETLVPPPSTHPRESGSRVYRTGTFLNRCLDFNRNALIDGPTLERYYIAQVPVRRRRGEWRYNRIRSRINTYLSQLKS